jgi:hypothetical protein
VKPWETEGDTVIGLRNEETINDEACAASSATSTSPKPVSNGEQRDVASISDQMNEPAHLSLAQQSLIFVMG